MFDCYVSNARPLGLCLICFVCNARSLGLCYIVPLVIRALLVCVLVLR